jgi:hypothetical protein
MTHHRAAHGPARHSTLSASGMKTLLLGFLAAPALALCQPVDAPSSEPLLARPATVRLGYERLRLPGGERLGLLGTTFLIDIGGGFAVGPAAYGAITGGRGGLFVVGAEAAWHHRIAGPLEFEAGVHAGGGGGGAAPVGGGLMLRSHLDLLYDLGGLKAGVSASRVRFPNGQIESSQLGLVLTVPTDFRFVERDRIGQPLSISGRAGMGFDRIQAVFGVYKPRSGSRRNSGGELTQKIGFVGTRLERAIDDHLYWGVEAAGAASGGVGGYAEYLGIVGTETAFFSQALTLGARVALGMGGGGDVGVGGGLLLKGGLYGTLRLARSLGVSIEGGLTRAPQGSFSALHGSASLVWVLDDPSDITAPPRTVRTDWVAGAERYNAARRDGTVRDLQLNVLKVSRFVTPSIYLTGQAHSAWGGGAGGYIAGMFGVGVQARLWSRLHAGAEALVGAAGGGGIDTQGGALVQPMVYLGMDVTRDLSLRVGAGRIKALHGALDAGVVEASVVFTFGVAEHGYR